MKEVYLVIAMLCDPQGAQCERVETTFVNETGSIRPCTDWLIDQLQDVVVTELKEGIILSFECRPEAKDG